ncbi:MAG: chorismate mutase [Acidimicrobiales bacterium]|nr:chorismate mutase [Acidimicrobiales bacterium]
MPTRALRGAITCDADSKDEILSRTAQVLTELFARNHIGNDCITSIFFTATADLTAVAPAAGARAFGLTDVPLLCAQEMAVAGSLPRCIRVMLHFDCDLARSELNHVFLRDATALRPDLSEPGDEL